MPKYKSIQEAVIGEVLPDIGKRNRSARKERIYLSEGKSKTPVTGLIKNVSRTPQSVVKRVYSGGCRNAKELRRQVEYVMRDEANVAAWSNQLGFDDDFTEDKVDGVIGAWQSSWRGNPKRGHTDHIILSFPKDTDAATAEAVGREWGHEVFGSGWHGDRYRYVASLHHNTEHVHVHFVVEKHGVEEGKFLSISQYSAINYDMMRQAQADIAETHGLSLNATSRLSRGIIENAPREVDIHAAREEDREPHVEPLSFVERARREAIMRGYAAEYRQLAGLATLNQEDDAAGLWARIGDGAQIAAARILEGDPIANDFASVNDPQPASLDAVGRLLEARETLISSLDSAWTTIQEMEPSAMKTELELEIAEHSRKAVEIIGEDDPFLSHATSVTAEQDTYAVPVVARLNTYAGNEEDRFHAESDKYLHDYREALEDRFAQYEDRFEGVGTSAEEMAARFAIHERSEAQLEAWRPDDPAERAAWIAFEREMQREASSVAADLPISRELSEHMALEEINAAQNQERLADIEALDRLISDIRHDMTDGDMDQVADGKLDPLMDRVHDPMLRQAVASELRHIAVAEQEGAELSGRDSGSVVQYRALAQQVEPERELTPEEAYIEHLHERAGEKLKELERKGRGRDDDDYEWGL